MLPVDKLRKIHCIEFPGFFEDFNRAINSLGGYQEVYESLKTNNRLLLNYRPWDFYARHVSGEWLSQCGFLIKISRKKSSIAQPINQEIIGIVENVCRFNKICDFQIETPLLLCNLFSQPFSDDILDSNQPLHLIPSVFSTYDDPVSIDSVFPKILDNKQIIKELNKNVDDTCEISSGSIIPSISEKGNRNDIYYEVFAKFDDVYLPNKKEIHLNKLSLETDELYKNIMEIFKQRPICTKVYIENHLKNFHKTTVRSLLPYFAYYWVNGPWARTWNIYGFDPRIDSSAYKYQTIDFRIPKDIIKESCLIKLKKSKRWKDKRLTKKTLFDCISENTNNDTPNKYFMHTFTKDNCIPVTQQSFQIIDIDQSITQLQDYSFRDENSKPSCIDGWLNEGVVSSIRKNMNKTIIDAVENIKNMETTNINSNNSVSVDTIIDDTSNTTSNYTDSINPNFEDNNYD